MVLAACAAMLLCISIVPDGTAQSAYRPKPKDIPNAARYGSNPGVEQNRLRTFRGRSDLETRIDLLPSIEI